MVSGTNPVTPLSNTLASRNVIATYTVPATFFPGVYFDNSQWDFAVDVSEFFENRVPWKRTGSRVTSQVFVANEGENNRSGTL